MIDAKRLATDAEYWDSVAPEGATRYDERYLYPWRRSEEGCELYFSAALQNWVSTSRRKDSEGIPRPKAPEADWVDGWPPVGCECEYRPDPSSNFWDKCAYLAHFDGEHFVLVLDTGNVDRMPDRTPAHERFRPIRTKEQRQRGELALLVAGNLDVQFNGEFKVDVGSAVDAILSRYSLTPKD